MDVEGDLLGEVATCPNRPTQSVGERQQRLVAGASVRVRRQVAAGLPNHVSQNPTVVEVTVHTAAVQYEHSHGRVKHNQQFDEKCRRYRPSGSIERRARVTEPRSRAETSTIVGLYQPSDRTLSSMNPCVTVTW